MLFLHIMHKKAKKSISLPSSYDKISKNTNQEYGLHEATTTTQLYKTRG